MDYPAYMWFKKEIPYRGKSHKPYEKADSLRRTLQKLQRVSLSLLSSLARWKQRAGNQMLTFSYQREDRVRWKTVDNTIHTGIIKHVLFDGYLVAEDGHSDVELYIQKGGCTRYTETKKLKVKK